MALHLDRETIDFVVEDQDLRQALGQLFLLMGVKYDLPPEVQGRVSVNIHNVTFEQALQYMLGSEYTYTIGPHDVLYVHLGGTTWQPGNENIP